MQKEPETIRVPPKKQRPMVEKGTALSLCAATQGGTVCKNRGSFSRDYTTLQPDPQKATA